MDAVKAVVFGLGAGIGGVLLMYSPTLIPAATAVANEPIVQELLQTPNQMLHPAIDTDGLLKWDFHVQPGTSIEPTHESTIRKIAYGRTTFVNVMQTDSGVYSSDGLASPNVEYPGIVKEPKPGTSPILWFWGDGRWSTATAFGAGSFVTATPFKGGKLVVTDEGSCVVRDNSVYC